MLDIALLDSTTYRIAAAIICITCLFYSTMMRKRNRIRNRLFLLLVIFTLIGCCTEPLSYLAISAPIPDTIKWIISYVCQMIYYITHYAIALILFLYIVSITGTAFKFSKGLRRLIVLPLILLEIMLLTNPFTELTFRITGKFTYGRGAGLYLAYAASVAYFLAGFLLLVKSWYVINGMKRVAMIYFMVLALTGALVQLFFPQVKCELLCEAIGLSGILIMIEKDDDRMDSQSEAYNRSAFVQDVTAFFKLGRAFKAVCIRIENLDNYRKLFGYERIDKLVSQIADFLMDNKKETIAYRTGVEVFYLLCTDYSDEDIRALVDRITERFGRTWEYEGSSIRLDTRILVADCPGQFSSINDIFLLDSSSLDGTEKKILIGSDLDFLVRKIEVEKAIGRGISDKKFSYLYTPVYSMDGLKIKLAHMTIKLQDEILGVIPTREFMEVAEGTGFIDEIQYKIIEEVCRFLSYGVDKSDMQMDFVFVPIMSATVIKNEFVKNVKNIVDHYGIDPSLIAFVLKESYAIYAREAMSQMMSSFVSYGIRMYISEYEAGFLGLNTLVNYEFEGVILDIRSIYETDNDNMENADIVLQNRVNMIIQLKKNVVLSGIDSRLLYDKMLKVPINYAEGDFLSPTISKNELQNRFWHGEHLVITKDGVERLEEDE